MHIEVRVKGKKKKYYLAHSFRYGKRVRKLRFYLGTNLSRKELTQKRKYAETVIAERLRALRIIRDPFRTVLSPAELKEVKSLEARGEIKIHHLSEHEWLKWTEAFTYDSNAIEGSTVTASEVAGVLERGQWPPSRTRNEISETYGLAEAVNYIRKVRTQLSLDLIKKLHRITFKNSLPFAGRLRVRGEEVAVVDAAGNIIHRGAPSTQVVGLLKELVDWYGRNRERYPPLVLAAVVHNQFENIHPFRDGNGRVGRLLLNNILLKHGLPPVNIEFKRRAEYYRALQEYGRAGNIRPMLELILIEWRQLRKLLKR